MSQRERVQIQAVASAFEVGIHNATLAIVVAQSVLERPDMALPAAVAVSYMWRALGVAVSGRIDPDSDLFLWIHCVAYAMLAGLVSRMLFLPSGALAASDPPHILVSGDGKLAAVRAKDGQWLYSSARKARWTARSWQRMTGREKYSLWPDHGRSPDGRLSCDALGCLYRAEGKTVALVSREDALDEDCAVAQLVLATVPLRGACNGPSRAADCFDLWRNGAYAVWLDGGKIRVKNVRESRGDRPWVQQKEGGR